MPLHCATEGIFSTPIHFVVHFILDMVLRQSHPESGADVKIKQEKPKPRLSDSQIVDLILKRAEVVKGNGNYTDIFDVCMYAEQQGKVGTRRRHLFFHVFPNFLRVTRVSS